MVDESRELQHLGRGAACASNVSHYKVSGLCHMLMDELFQWLTVIVGLTVMIYGLPVALGWLSEELVKLGRVKNI